jgi:hypothetical protein
VIFVGSDVPGYLVGAEDPHQQRIIELIPRLLSVRDDLVTSAGVFQEVLHRYLAVGDREHLNAARLRCLRTRGSRLMHPVTEVTQQCPCGSAEGPSRGRFSHQVQRSAIGSDDSSHADAGSEVMSAGSVTGRMRRLIPPCMSAVFRKRSTPCPVSTPLQY